MPEPPAGARGARRSFLRATALGVAALALAGIGVAVVLNWTVPTRIPHSCTVTLDDGSTATLDADQADNAALITAITLRRGLPPRAATIALATAVQESKLRNITYGDRDSLGLFQQRPSQGWGTEDEVQDPVYATNAFYDGLVTVEGYADMPVTEAAQRVQRSAFPEAYADHEPAGRAFASALTGHSTASLTCRLRPAPTDDDVSDVVLARLERDLGPLDATTSSGVVVVPVSGLPEAGSSTQDEQLGWAVAQWAVATASETGARTVVTDGQVWQRDDGNQATWRDVAEVDLPGAVAGLVADAATGTVLIS